MTKKIYVIRKIAYGFDDEQHYERAVGAITDTFDDERAAYQRLTELETARFRDFDPVDYEQFGHYGRYHPHNQAERKALDAFLKAEFGESFLGIDERTNQYHVKKRFFEIANAANITDAQIMKFREIIGLRFHVLHAFEEEARFYALWLPHRDEFYRVTYVREDNAIYFYNSYDEALAATKEGEFIGVFDDFNLPGRPEDLSEQPVLLTALINTTNCLHYNDAKAQLELRPVWKNDMTEQAEHLASLNALLKQPLFEIRDFSLEDAKNVPHDPFEVI